MLALCICFYLCLCVSSSHLSLPLFHSCDGRAWESRGVVTVKSERSTSGNLTQHSVPPRFLSCMWSQAQSDGFYFLRAPVSFSPDGTAPEPPNSSSQFVQTFTKSRHLFCSDLSDAVTIYTDSRGSILSIFSESRRGCGSVADWSRGVRSQGRDRFSSSLSLLHAHQFPGPEPAVQAFLDGERRKEASKEKGEDKSFLQKYWHYLLIGLLIYTLMTALGGGGEEGEGASS